MTLKKNFKKYLSDSHKRKGLLYTSSKRVFIVTIFLFFLSYFSIAASFYDTIFIPLFLPIYVGAIVSFIIFSFMSVLKYGEGKVPSVILYILCIILASIGVSFLIPIF